MPPEPAPLNIGSPRVRAAMRVLGLSEKEVEKRPKEAFHTEVAYEVFERKRRMLAENVNDLAKDSPEAGSIPGAADKSRDANADFMAGVIAIEKRNIEKMNIMSKKEIQKMMIKELETNHAAHKSVLKQEESVVRQNALEKERREAMKKVMKEAQKRLDKSTDVRAKAAKQVLIEAEKLKNELTEKDAQVTKKLQDIVDGREEGKVKAQEKRDQATERKEQHDQATIAKQEKMYATVLDRDEQVEFRLSCRTSDSQHNSAIFAAKKAACTERARHQLADNQARYEANFLKREGEHHVAAQCRDSNAKTYLKEFKKRNDKERKDFETRYERVKKEEEKPHISRRLEKMASMGDIQSQGCLSRPEFHHMVHSNKSMVDLCEFNGNLLKRAHGYHQEQELDKIAGVRAKVKAIWDSRKMAQDRRTQMVKNVAVAKYDLALKVDRARTQGPSKMSSILSEMEPDPEAAARINELLGAMNMELLPGTKAVEEE